MTLSRRSVLKGGLAAAVVSGGAPARAEFAPRPIINDASRLNPTSVAKHIALKSASTDEVVNRVREEIASAAAEGRPFAIGTARHSMGGQSIPKDGVAITLTGGPIEIDRTSMTYRVGAGMRWFEVIRALDAQGFSPAVMQSNSDFGVGSTFCVNSHGWPTRYGPFGSTVRSARIMLADGQLVECSRSKEAELFALAMGGYGLLGAIIDLELDMAPNALLEPTYARMDPSRFADAFINAVEKDPAVRMAYGRLSVARGSLFDEALMITYRPAATQPSPLPAVVDHGALTAFSRDVYRFQTGREWAKNLRWFMEASVNPSIAGAATRNALMAEPVVNLASGDPTRTDILHEYFVPPDRFTGFVDLCRRIIPKARAEFLNVTLRYVDADPVAVLAYAPGKRIAAVMSFAQEIGPEGEVDMMGMTEALIEGVKDLGGAFYLPYRLHARRDQLRAIYPRTAEFVAAKRRLDPSLVFRNMMWDAYFS
ncbi:FAD-binding oxidoreductase [Bradyrhizobium jicamae]|uniref:FAD-binding oxidoreductase n=1 Tax=Bradyrhizobium jicamae TaxID=280332 RepID=A0ABS5FI17_9BRAD|nr:FAD-binding oxidoreductase [Bradyrhizobium jicamae]